jgi:hypothetical protein
MGKPELWFTSAMGGSGVYDWSVKDPTIATVEGSALIKSISVGKTILMVSDHRNSQNKAQITVEVAPIHSLTWIEHQLELAAGTTTTSGGSQEISVIAKDLNGRKFTNCTGADITYATKSDGIISVKPIH